MNRDAATRARRRSTSVALIMLLAIIACYDARACEPLGMSRDSLLSGDHGQLALPDDSDPGRLALALVDCLDDPDPTLRDAIGYTGLATLMRDGSLSAPVMRELRDRLLDMLAREDTSGDGFAQPFAALTLAEVARVDRLSPFLDVAERQELVAAATAYLRGVRDYRGFNDAEGWRHGVAHGADFLMQLVLNPELDDEDVRAIVDAALSQVAAAGGHAYVFGESERLARPVLFAARREVISAEEWQTLFESLAAPPGESWSDAFSSEARLAVLHNTKAFVTSIYANVAESQNTAYASLRDASRAALQALP